MELEIIQDIIQLIIVDIEIGSWSNRAALTSNTTSTSFNYDLNNLNLRPGDLIKFDIDTWIVSDTSGYNSYWFYNNDTQNTGNKTVYKDGIIYYKDLNGTVHECTMGYSKDINGSTHKARYIQVKDINGTAHSIDVYTTKCEQESENILWKL